MLLVIEPNLARAEWKAIRYRLLHTAARITRGSRRLYLRLQVDWPWALALAHAFTVLAASPSRSPPEHPPATPSASAATNPHPPEHQPETSTTASRTAAHPAPHHSASRFIEAPHT